MSADKSEQATDQRKKKAREKGDVVHSRELISGVAMLGGLMLLGTAAQRFLTLWRSSYDGVLLASLRTFDSPEQMIDVCGRLLLPAFSPLLLVMAAALAGALASGLMQTGGVQFRVEALSFKFNRLSPISNLTNIFSMKSVIRLAKSLAPAGAVVFLAYGLLRHMLLSMPVMSAARLPQTLTSGYSLALDAAWITVGWSALDYAVEWRSWSQRLKMTKQEIKDEAKESNGNPHTKGRIRNIQRAMRKRRVQADVSKATVVITNPTHYAVALEFSYETMSAPKLLCKGRDLHAAQIREAARWAGVPLIENPPLARSLYRSVDEGQPIPFELYAAVAAILAFLFKQESKRTQQQTAYGSTGYTAPVLPRFDLPNRIVMEPQPMGSQPTEDTL